MKLNTKKAKNVIIFVGDGMGVQTHTASRIYKGQSFLQFKKSEAKKFGYSFHLIMHYEQ